MPDPTGSTLSLPRADLMPIFQIDAALANISLDSIRCRAFGGSFEGHASAHTSRCGSISTRNVSGLQTWQERHRTAAR